MDNLGPVVTAITALSGFIMAAAALWNARGARQKGQGDYTKAIADASAALIEPLTARIDSQGKEVDVLRAEVRAERAAVERLSVRVKLLENENAELRAGVALLTTQVVALGQKPLYQPKDPNNP